MQHNSHQINVIPLGDDKNILLSQFKEGLMTVCGMPTWNGRERLSNVEFDGLQFCISIPSIGGIITASLISSELKQQDRDNIFPVHWGNNFRLCILVCRFKDLLEIREIREDIAYYRYTMCNLQRSEDVFLLVTDVEQVVDLHNYSDYDIAQLSFHELLAEGSDSTSVITWKNGNDEKWKTISPQSFGQTICYYPWHRKQTAIYLDSLYAHWKLSAESGFVEIVWQVANNLLQDYNIQLSEMSNNINYIIMCKRIKSWWNEKTMERIHVAVVGVPSSGKTLLIRDMKETLRSMGYEIQDPLNTAHGSLRNFDYNVGDKIKKDERYAMRAKNIYDAVLSYGNGKKHLNITFVNVPGEAFNQDDLAICTTILDAIEDLKFTIRTLKTNFKEASIVEYVEIGEEQLLNNTSRPKRTLESYNDWGETLSILGVYKENYKDTYGKANKKVRDGSYIIEHFFDFDTDSIINAINDAWDIIRIAITKEHNKEISESDWFDKYSRDLSFLLYLKKTTDVVFCEKILDNQGGLCENADIAFNAVCNHVGRFLQKNAKISKYVAFRAIDVVLNIDIFKQILNSAEKFGGYQTAQIKNICLSNIVYSYFLCELYGTRAYKSTESTELDAFKSQLFDKNRGNIEIPLFDQNVKLILDKDMLKTHAEGTLNSLNEIMNLTPNLIDSSHVYYTGTPITKRFEKYTNQATEANTAEFKNEQGQLFNISSSICFGAMQLCIDILQQHGKFNHSGDKTYGKVLNTSFRKQ